MSSRLASCAVASLTRRVGGLSLANKASPFSTMAKITRGLVAHRVTPSWAPAPSTLLPSLSLVSTALDQPFAQTTRTMVTRKKRLARRENRRLAAKRAEKSGDGKVSFMSKKGNILDALTIWTKFLNRNFFWLC